MLRAFMARQRVHKVGVERYMLWTAMLSLLAFYLDQPPGRLKPMLAPNLGSLLHLSGLNHHVGGENQPIPRLVILSTCAAYFGHRCHNK